MDTVVLETVVLETREGAVLRYPRSISCRLVETSYHNARAANSEPEVCNWLPRGPALPSGPVEPQIISIATISEDIYTFRGGVPMSSALHQYRASNQFLATMKQEFAESLQQSSELCSAIILSVITFHLRNTVCSLHCCKDSINPCTDKMLLSVNIVVPCCSAVKLSTQFFC